MGGKEIKWLDQAPWALLLDSAGHYTKEKADILAMCLTKEKTEISRTLKAINYL